VDNDDAIMLMDGFDDCVIGYVQQFNNCMACYDYEKVIAKLVSDGMTEDEAVEFWSSNQVGAYVGKGTPAFFFKATAEEINDMVDEGVL
jgi:hypothetical protein